MRLMLATLIAAVGAAPLALAQTPPPATPPATAPAAAPPAATPPVASPPAAAPEATLPAAATPAPEAAPPAPPPPPAPPTDPVAIAILDTLQNVCIPAVEGGDLAKLAKADGYRKNGDGAFVLGRQGYKFTILPPGSNPTQCHVDMVHPIYPEAPAAAIVVALHNWSAVERNWSLYRNDKNVEGNQQLTTRSWEHDDPGKHEAMFITTYRHADGSPMGHSSDNSTVVYSEDKTGG